MIPYRYTGSRRCLHVRASGWAAGRWPLGRQRLRWLRPLYDLVGRIVLSSDKVLEQNLIRLNREGFPDAAAI